MASSTPDFGPPLPAEDLLNGETQEMRRVRDTFIGPYRIEVKLGDGGMGVVYKAFDPKLQRFVAVKVIKEKLAANELYLERLRREARLMASLSHPAVVSIFAFEDGTGEPPQNGSSAGLPAEVQGALRALGPEIGRHLPYLVMEYVEGESIEAWLKRGERFGVAAAAALLREAARGLEAALARGIIHRDIKPSNLLITRNGTLKIVDFGLAKELAGGATITDVGMVLGTPHYISPEQGQGEKVDHRSDIYSLGSTFYHMITGRPAFHGDSQAAVIFAHIHHTPEPPHRVAAGIPEAASLVIGKMIAKHKEDRYGSYPLLIEDLSRLERGEGVLPDTLAGGKRTFQAPRAPYPRGVKVLLASLTSLLAASLAILAFLIAHTWSQGSMAADPLAQLSRFLKPSTGMSQLLQLDFQELGSDPAGWFEKIFFIEPKARSASPPSIQPRHGGLSWNDFAQPFALRCPLERVEELKLTGLHLGGWTHLAVALIDPDGDQVRRLVFPLQGEDPARNVPRAERHGERMAPEPAAGSLPALAKDLSYDLWIGFKNLPGKTAGGSAGQAGGKTAVTVELSRSRSKPGGSPPEGGAAQSFVLDGDDWNSGILVFLCQSASRPQAVSASLQGLTVVGRLARGEGVTKIPWRIQE